MLEFFIGSYVTGMALAAIGIAAAEQQGFPKVSAINKFLAVVFWPAMIVIGVVTL